MNNFIIKKIINQLTDRKPGLMDEEHYLVSAVLLPLIKKQGNLHVLFEVRAENLKIQPGEICFPGGQVETEERQRPYAAAVRETMEELGITREKIRLLGPLDILPTPYGRFIYPYVGEILTTQLNPNAEEVAEVFTVPIEFFLRHPPGRSRTEVAVRYASDFPFPKVPPGYKRGWQKRWSFPVYYFEYGKYFIWGITAKILFHFLKLCWPDEINYHL